METIDLAKLPENPNNPEIQYIQQDFLLNALNQDPSLNKKSYFFLYFDIFYFFFLKVITMIWKHPMQLKITII